MALRIFLAFCFLLVSIDSFSVSPVPTPSPTCVTQTFPDGSHTVCPGRPDTPGCMNGDHNYPGCMFPRDVGCRPCPSPCKYTYGDWIPAICPSTLQQVRDLISALPLGCWGTPDRNRACTQQACQFTYSAWGFCGHFADRPGQTLQRRTETGRTPLGCVGSPILEQSCQGGATEPICTEVRYREIVAGDCVSPAFKSRLQEVSRAIDPLRPDPSCRILEPETTVFCQKLCTIPKFSAWSACVGDVQTRVLMSNSLPTACYVPSTELSQQCSNNCAAPVYSAWGACVGVKQYRTLDVAASTPAGCLAPENSLTQSCTTPFEITQQPQDQSVILSSSGSTILSRTFQAKATGTGPLTYQWFKVGQAAALVPSTKYKISRVGNFNSATFELVVANINANSSGIVSPSDLGEYYLVVTEVASSGGKKINSRSAQLFANPAFLSSTKLTYPAVVTKAAKVVAGGSARISSEFTVLPIQAKNILWQKFDTGSSLWTTVSENSTAQISNTTTSGKAYQWQSTLILSDVQAAQAGRYRLYLAGLGAPVASAEFELLVDAACSYTYSAWTPVACPASGKQTRVVLQKTASCLGLLTLEQTCLADTPPEIWPLLSAQAIATNGVATYYFQVADALTPLSDLKVSAQSTNAALVSSAEMTIAGTGGARTLSVRPKPGQTGKTSITVSVSDGKLTTALPAFEVMVGQICSSFVLSEWGPCVDGIKTRTSTGQPVGCAGGAPGNLWQACSADVLPPITIVGETAEDEEPIPSFMILSDSGVLRDGDEVSLSKVFGVTESFGLNLNIVNMLDKAVDFEVDNLSPGFSIDQGLSCESDIGNVDRYELCKAMSLMISLNQSIEAYRSFNFRVIKVPTSRVRGAGELNMSINGASLKVVLHVPDEGAGLSLSTPEGDNLEGNSSSGYFAGYALSRNCFSQKFYS